MKEAAKEKQNQSQLDCIIGDGRLSHRRSKTPSGQDIVHGKHDGEAHEDIKRGRRLTGQ